MCYIVAHLESLAMLHRRDENGLIVIGQSAHAWAMRAALRGAPWVTLTTHLRSEQARLH
jgi:hypothetical protein